MKPIKKKTIKQLKKNAEANTSTSYKVGRDQAQPLKEGVPNDHSSHYLGLHETTTPQVVGMNKGLTKNMDNFESFRADVWLSDVVGADETPEDALDRISGIIDERLAIEVSALED